MKSPDQKHEDRIAKEMGGRKTLNSGSRFFDKGDGKDGEWGWDCKTTKNQSFSIKRKDWEKLETDLWLGEGLRVLMHIQLDNTSFRPLELVVISKDDFLELLEAKNNE